MNRDQYIDRIRVNLEDAGIFYSGLDLTDSVQDCYDEIIALSGSIMKGVKIPIQAGLSFYDLKKFLPDYLAVVAIYCSMTSMWLSPSSKREIANLRWDWTNQNGSPILFYPINHRYIGIYPCPLSVNDNHIFYVFYRASANRLIGTDVPQFPQEYDHALECSVTSDLFEQQLEYKKAALNFKEYQEHLKQLISYIKENKNPDRLFMLDTEQPTGGFMRPY